MYLNNSIVDSCIKPTKTRSEAGRVAASLQSTRVPLAHILSIAAFCPYKRLVHNVNWGVFATPLFFDELPPGFWSVHNFPPFHKCKSLLHGCCWLVLRASWRSTLSIYKDGETMSFNWELLENGEGRKKQYVWWKVPFHAIFTLSRIPILKKVYVFHFLPLV